MAPAGLDTREIGRDERRRDAVLVNVAYEVIRVVEFERQAEDRGNGGQRDVTLVPVQPDADDLLALPGALANDSAVDERRGVGTCLRRCQREAGDLLAGCEPRQPPFLLFFRAVMQQQLRRAERIGHADGRRCGRVPARKLCDHHRVGESRELQAAVLLRNDHGKETVFLDIGPDLRCHVAALMRDVPVVEHAAELFAGAIEKRLLFLGQLRRGERHQSIPVGHTGKQFTVPPDVAGLQRLLFGVGHRRQQRAVHIQSGPGDAFAAEVEQVGNDQ